VSNGHCCKVLDTECQRVKTHYWESRFMAHSAHRDLLLHFSYPIASINSSKTLQVSIDGPTVNHKFYSKLVEQRKEISAPGMIDIGSCGLHILHGTFKTVLEAPFWALKSVLERAHTVLHDTPAHRADYFTVTRSDQYPLLVCETRWPNMQKLFQFSRSLPKGQQPSGKSFETERLVI